MLDLTRTLDVEPLGCNDNTAVRLGFTRHVYCDGGLVSFAALVKPDADLDGTFRAFDTDNQEWLNVNGWLFLIEDAN